MPTKRKPAARYTIAELVDAIRGGTLPAADRARLKDALGMPRRPGGRKPILDDWMSMNVLHFLHRELGLSVRNAAWVIVRDSKGLEEHERPWKDYAEEIKKLTDLYHKGFKRGKGARPFGGPIETTEK